jgi:myo-inositol-1(or 4)-monophosphatase
MDKEKLYKDSITKAIRKAGNFVKRNQKKIKDISFKEGKEIVTNIDNESEKIIKAELKKTFPSYNYYGEEEGLEDNGSDFTFYIDPLDGTGRYVTQTPWYSVTIALLKNDRPYVGAIFIPGLDELYYAEKGKGAFLNGEKICVSASSDFVKDRVSASSKTNLVSEGYEAVKSVGFDACLIAKGELDGMIKIYKSDRRPVETPAIYLLIKEAGGEVSDFKGEEWKLDTKDIVVSNGKVHGRLVEKSSNLMAYM